MSIHQVYDFPIVGPQDAYLLYHEEMESLCQNIKGLKRIRFWMTFSEKYLTHLKVLENVGMTSIEPIEFKGHKVQPIEFLKAVLPDPASLGSRTRGKTCIGCDIVGAKTAKRNVSLSTTCDHQGALKVSSKRSATTGVPDDWGTNDTQGLWKNLAFGTWNNATLIPLWKSSSCMACRGTLSTAAGLNHSADFATRILTKKAPG